MGAVEYRREGRAAGSELARAASAARDLPCDAPLPERYLHRLAPAPWVCAGELQPDGKALAGPVRDLRDVLRAIACDLGARSSVRMQFPRLLPYGDVTVSGGWTPPDADGVQVLRAGVSVRPPARQAPEPREVAERLAVFCFPDAAGEVRMTRRVDGERGLLLGFEGVMDLTVEEERRAHRRATIEDRWELVAVRENQDFDFRKRVGAAIEAGTAFVREAIEEKESYLRDARGERNYGSGRLALALLTLVHGHVPAGDPVLERGFDDLRRRRIEDSYSLAAALMAVAARGAPPGQTGAGLDERDRKAAKEWVERLLGNVDPRVDRDELLRFNYVAGPRYDTSLQQYGLLGLWSAHCGGLAVPHGAFAAAARHLLEVQGPPGERLKLRLTSYATLRDAAGTDRAPHTPEVRTAARGFAYEEAGDPPFGSMTSAGISGLLLAKAGIEAQGRGERALLSRIDDGVRDGFAWLAADFSVRCNPGFAERADNHWYYWLYGLERSCELAGVAWLQDRDWYYEGALQLLSQQQSNGSFRAEHSSTLLLDATCFAVLFLAKSRPAAAITPR
jgi:hypothetical protein